MLEIKGLSKTYTVRGRNVEALVDISFSCKPGDFTVVCGHSGCGKSTLILAIGSMLRPTSGNIAYKGKDIYRFSAGKCNRYRKYTVGFIFQRFFLIPYISAHDNILLPLPPRSRNKARLKAAALAERLGITGRLEHMPPQLSVGEMQRVATARALITDPEIILADEPTGNLDPSNADVIADCLSEEAEKGRIIILATHDKALTQLGSKRIDLKEGRMKE